MTAAQANGARDHAAQAWNVLPPGQAGGVGLTRSSTDQIALYEGLTRLRENVTAADLRRYFKPETLGLAPATGPSASSGPASGVTITRDRWGVPHVKGRTAEDVAFGAGWATAADRQVQLELLRGPGRLAALDAPGIDRSRSRSRVRTFRPSPQTEAVLARQFDLLRARGAAGRGGPDRRRVRRGDQRAVPEAGLALAGGRATTSSRSAPWWARSSARAAGTRCAARSSSTRSSAGSGRSRRRVWEDLRQRNDPEARVAVPAARRIRSVVSEIGNTVVDASARRRRRRDTTRLPMSNALLVGARRSTTGKPLFVAGPQVGHFYPPSCSSSTSRAADTGRAASRSPASRSRC